MAQRIRVTHLLLAGGLVLAAGPAFAQEGMLFKNLMEGTFGGGGPGGDIDYRERAPLVVPPNSTLPPPQQPASARNAAWPRDPDVLRRKEEKSPRPYVEDDGNRHNPMLSARELQRGRTANAPRVAPPRYGNNDSYTNQLEPIRIGRELAAKRNLENESKLTYGEEPERKTLTEPPVGYRRPANTAALGPGASGPVEDKQASGEREFVTGQRPVLRP
ncbi:hypothetical protein [Bosea sp. (in: a-proteobacteria)]|uniref:hypothetical protein n=1 Tax=Bosea sp. (in: a-proteobacteria) TaxID=1871050 RepID=UPI001AC92859|nr:hypothetical protein [Bosea sp. (in: a-proteobacteria)]MBN9443832.1 hypothetical protein [Bosea sp. (in: a-proteobacteria)]